MSAKQRQETLETFCVPVERDTQEIANVHLTPIVPVSGGQQTRRSARSSRREGQQADAMTVYSDDDDDFVPQVDADSDDGVDGPRMRNKKGKAKAKGKRKATTRSHLAPAHDTAAVNPKVMLISLKAGALGLNLTVANNIYL